MMNEFDDLFKNVPIEDEKTRPSFDKKVWAEAKKQERIDAFNLIDKTAEEIVKDPAKLRTYLDVQSRFDRYSLANALLITAQMPDAMKLADYETWKKNGTYVNKGANSIVILGPGEEYTKPDGSIGVSYNTKRVFDISQTNSPELKSYPRRDDRLLIKALMSNAPCAITISEDVSEKEQAIYNKNSNAVFIHGGMSGEEIFMALARELSRAVLEGMDNKPIDARFSAECAGYMLCKRSGLDVSKIRIDVPGKISSLETKEIKSVLSQIRTVTNQYIGDMNRFFEEQNKDRQPEAR